MVADEATERVRHAARDHCSPASPSAIHPLSPPSPPLPLPLSACSALQTRRARGQPPAPAPRHRRGLQEARPRCRTYYIVRYRKSCTRGLHPCAIRPTSQAPPFSPSGGRYEPWDLLHPARQVLSTCRVGAHDSHPHRVNPIGDLHCHFIAGSSPPTYDNRQYRSKQLRNCAPCAHSASPHRQARAPHAMPPYAPPAPRRKHMRYGLGPARRP